MQEVWRVTGARWSPVWTACPASWSGSPPTTAACCRPPTAPGPHQQTPRERQWPRGPSRSPPRPPARTPTLSIKSYRPSHLGLYNPSHRPVVQQSHTLKRKMYGRPFLPEKKKNRVWKIIRGVCQKNSTNLKAHLLTGLLLSSQPHRTVFTNEWSLIFYIKFYRFYSYWANSMCWWRAWDTVESSGNGLVCFNNKTFIS